MMRVVFVVTLIMLLVPLALADQDQGVSGPDQANNAELAEDESPSYTAISDGSSSDDTATNYNQVELSLWAIIALSLMSLALLTSVCISFYLYRWRRILISSQRLLVPEELIREIFVNRKSISKLEESTARNSNSITSHSNKILAEVASLIETTMTLHTALNERDREIERLRQGNDVQVFRRFLNRFVRVHQVLSDFEQSGESGVKELAQTKRLLEDALDECGVRTFEPEIGGDFRNVDGVADNPKHVHTSNPDENFKIVEVIEPGYRIETSESNFDVIAYAKVAIFVYHE